MMPEVRKLANRVTLNANKLDSADRDVQPTQRQNCKQQGQPDQVDIVDATIPEVSVLLAEAGNMHRLKEPIDMLDKVGEEDITLGSSWQ